MAEVANDSVDKSKQNADHSNFEKKLNDQDKIMKEGGADPAQEEDSDILDEDGNFDERVFKFKNWKSYKHN